ncbi:putative beta-glucosidase [Helianthus debilis subsp. tardiflorus]
MFPPTSRKPHQIEGVYLEEGKSLTNWDVFCHSKGCGENGDNGDIVDNHYHLSMNFSFRFSTSKHHPVRNPKVSLILILDQWEKKVNPCQLAHSDNQKPPGVQSLHPHPQGMCTVTSSSSYSGDVKYFFFRILKFIDYCLIEAL